MSLAATPWRDAPRKGVRSVVDASVEKAQRRRAARVALLGTGTVGRAVLRRLAGWRDTALGERLALMHVANSRVAMRCDARTRGGRDITGMSLHDIPSIAAAFAAHGEGGAYAKHPTRDIATRCAFVDATLDAVAESLGEHGARIVIDATASDVVADRHAQWLRQGIHVATACKLGQGVALKRWREIRDAQCAGATHYGDSATVGAGLPLLRSIRALRAGGDRIHAIAGVLSGSLAWLFHHYDGLRPFSGFVRQARDAGYTEPDPRDDLSGEDVRRKLLILARAAGHELERDAVEVTSLAPTALVGLHACEVDAALPMLDAPLRARYADAYKRGERLRFVARLDAGDARIGLESLPSDHPLIGGHGADNRVAIWSDRYGEQPLVIQGPGAGAEVTAAALLDDVLAIASWRCID